MFNVDPKIYVADLAAYNSGVLYGKWIDATTSVEDMQVEIEEMLANSPVENAEEWAIYDHEGLGNIGEYERLEEIAKRVSFIEFADKRNVPAEVVIEFSENRSFDDVWDLERGFDEAFAGTFEVCNEGDWAHELAESLGYEIPDWLECHVDWDSVARNFLMDYNQIEHNGKVYLFHIS